MRFAGEPVAVVLAADRHVAQQAAALITAEYEEYPGVFDEVEAMTSTTLVHDELKPAATFPDLQHLKGRKGTNVALDYHLLHGDPDAGFAASDHIFEHEFRTQQVMHTPMEPFVSVADAQDGHVTLHTASQGPSFVRIEIARLLGLPENRVRVRVPHLGGGFGGKLYIKLEALVTALSMVARRPVKISLTMEEQFFMVTRHPCTFPHQERRDEGRPDPRASLRGDLERRRLCGHRTARDPRRRASPRPAPTTSRMSRSIPMRSTPTGRHAEPCAASARRRPPGPTSATPT